MREHGKSRVATIFSGMVSTPRIILKTYRDYKPLRFFGYIATFLFILALCLSLFPDLLEDYDGWFVSAYGRASSIFCVCTVMVTIGIVAEMLDRMRVANDEVLFRIRRLEYMLNEKAEETGSEES